LPEGTQKFGWMYEMTAKFIASSKGTLRGRSYWPEVYARCEHRPRLCFVLPYQRVPGNDKQPVANPDGMNQTNYIRDSFKSIGRSLSLQSCSSSRKHFSGDRSQPYPFRGD
jgi:hypothetical protein